MGKVHLSCRSSQGRHVGEYGPFRHNRALNEVVSSRSRPELPRVGAEWAWRFARRLDRPGADHSTRYVVPELWATRGRTTGPSLELPCVGAECAWCIARRLDPLRADLTVSLRCVRCVLPEHWATQGLTAGPSLSLRVRHAIYFMRGLDEHLRT